MAMKPLLRRREQVSDSADLSRLNFNAKRNDLSDVFGILKGKLNMSAQEIKDKLRKGWK